MINLKTLKVVIPGGGSGPISLEDALLDLTPNITAITNVTDNGGHTKEIRSVLGVSPTGDATQRWAVRIRNNADIRSLLTYRFPENGQRAANPLLAAAEKITGSHAQGIQLIGEALKCHIVGNVIPVSNSTETHLKVLLNGSKSIIGEENLDDFMQTKQNYLATKIDFLPSPPRVNPEVVKTLKQADLIIIPPGSRLGSLMAVLEVPGVFTAIHLSVAKIICFTNAVDVKGYKASDFLKYLSDKIGRKLDLAVINKPNFNLPKTYQESFHFFVEPDKEICLNYAQEVVETTIARLFMINNKPTIRHDGNKAAKIIKQFLEG